MTVSFRSLLVACVLFGCSEGERAEPIGARRQAVDWKAMNMITAGENDDGFGTDVAIDGNFVAAVAPTASAGVTARVYEWTGTEFALRDELTSPSASMAFDGASVALRGDQLIVGDPDASPKESGSGIAHVYQRQAAKWVGTGELTPTEFGHLAHFGLSVAIDGNTAAVGAPDQQITNAQNGSVFVFVNGSSGWTQQAHLVHDNPQYKDRFGLEIALSGDLLAVGASTSESGTSAGSVFLYRRSGNDWSLEKQLTPPSASSDAYFGSSAVAIGSGLLVVGALGKYGKVSGSGLVYLFDETNGFAPITNLGASDADFGAGFGTSVAVSVDRILVGSLVNSAYVFERTNNVWSEIEKLTGDGLPNTSFGLEVDLTESAAIVGSPNTSLSVAGRAFVFGAPTASGGAGGSAGSGGSGAVSSGGGGGVSTGGLGGGPAGGAGTTTGSSKPDEASIYSCGASTSPRSPGGVLIALGLFALFARRRAIRTAQRTDRGRSA